MKKLMAFLCLLAICLPLAACADPSPESTENKPAEKPTEVKKTQAVESVKDFNIETDLPEGFAVGFGRVDISGPLPVDVWEGEATKVRDPIYLTCTAVSDGQNVALLMAADTRGIKLSAYESVAKAMNKKYGIPRENVLINVTHSHHAPTIGSNARWLTNFHKLVPVAVEEALRDLTPAKAYAGKGYTESLTFVRRYLLEDGSYMTNANAADKPVAHETEADNELRTVRFEREGKKDVLMVNYQTHYMGGINKAELSADIFGAFRKSVEKELGCLFVYYSGSSGNLNCNSPIEGERIYHTFEEAAVEFTRAVKTALENEAEVATGKVVAKTSVYKGTVLHDDPALVEKAKEIADAGRDTAQGKALIAKYGFISKYAATAVVTRANMGETQDLNFFAVSFGDIAFATAPYEQFDTNGREVRDASPFPVTFTLSITNESNGYVPSAYAFGHYSYEVAISRFIPGSGEEFAREQVRLLDECKVAS
ncbi:MAG: hypothetical protein E7580_01410 [Ruminococcaceae bacterium]|nr:hypothetical protein [Oscillospiraceae bacterium]